jgi:hypothetical protein
MASVTLDMIYGLALEVRDIQSGVVASTSEAIEEMRSWNSQMAAIRQNTRNIIALLDRQDACLSRIERRLDIVEPATA